MKTIDNNKLKEMAEECFKVIKAQNKALEDNQIEIESLKFKLSKKKVVIKEIHDNPYREKVTKVFQKLEKEQSEKDMKILELEEKVRELEWKCFVSGTIKSFRTTK